ncbi:hypothetical protein HY991_00520 [Candidatus Micrarchaeota archaeon]|nr:hypothetical protein [Candidatus Micrarchaeota archaeon]
MEKELYFKGHKSCPGCGPAIAIRNLLAGLGEDIIVSLATGCMEVTSTKYPNSTWNVPLIHSLFENTPAVASGVSRALKHEKKKGVSVCVGGDGGIYDIGFGALSGAMERNEDMVCICYDNECYANCLSRSTLIMTEHGIKKIMEIKEGDKIYAFNQKTYRPILKKCTGVFDNGEKPVFELETSHHSIKATSNHPFLILKRNGRGKQNTLIWKTLAKINIGDEVVVLKNLEIAESFRFKNIRLSKKGDYKVNKINFISIPEKSSPELMEYLGMYVGDGWCRIKKAETGFALPEKSKERKRLIWLHSRIFKNRVSRTDSNYLYINSVNLARFIDSMGFGHGAKNKTIPEWVFTIPKEEKKAFVRGLVSTDGYKVENSFRFVSSSRDLLNRLRLLLQTMNYRVGKIHWRKTKKGTKIVYRNLLEDTEGGYICFSEKKEWNIKKYPSQYTYQNFLIRNQYFEMEKVKYKKLIGTEPTLDLRVEGEHNFIADGIVVHNTGVQRSGATPFLASTTTSPAEVGGKHEWKKNVAFIATAHAVPYSATASIGFLPDFEKKLKKAKAMTGFRFIVVHAPCFLSWRFPNNQTVGVARSAVECGLWNLFEIENGLFKFTYSPAELKPVEPYLKLQGRYKHISAEGTNEIQEHAKRVREELKKLEESKINFQYFL